MRSNRKAIQMNVTFYDSRSSSTYSANVDAETTAQRCIEGLVSAAFLAPMPEDRPYRLKLQRTNQELLDSTTMEAAGVRDKDDLVVLQEEKGAEVSFA